MVTEAERTVKDDIQSLYLGNLRTVEYDLDLPSSGKNGSHITWKSGDERYVSDTGKVTRPAYGIGDRTVNLTATFSKDGVDEEAVYEVNVLEERNHIVIDAIYPMELERAVGETFYLPQVVVVKTDKGEVLPQVVVWDGGERRRYDQVGEHRVTGHVDATDYQVVGRVVVKEHLAAKTSDRKMKVRPFPMQAVRLTPGSPFERAQGLRLRFLKSVDDDQMLVNFRRAAGLDTKGAPDMVGWDTPDSNLRGHTTGHYLSALAQAYGATGDQEILGKLGYMVSELGAVQEAFAARPGIHPGFLSAYDERQFDLLEQFTTYPKIWAPYYTLHKILAGLLDAYQIAGLPQALDIARGIGDWTHARLKRLDPSHRKKMWGLYIAGEFGGMNESLATLARLTGDDIYLEAARFFDNDKLFFPMEWHIDALGSLHANQHIPQIVGALKTYEAGHEERYYQIARFFWNSVVEHHIYSFGGTGDGEMFQQPDVIGTRLNENSAESCASYNMLKLTRDLFPYEPDVEKMDYYENTMVNHVLGTADHEGIGGTIYFMGTQPGASKTFDTDNTCCHGTGLESQFQYGDSIYYESGAGLLVALYVPSRLKTETADLSIEADMADPGRVAIHVGSLCEPLILRHPAWSRHMSVRVNGLEVETTEQDRFLRVDRDLSAGDVVELAFEPTLRFVPTPDVPSLVSVAYGPYILAAIDQEEGGMADLHVHDAEELAKRVTKEPGTLVFHVDGMTMIPLFAVDHERYSVYFSRG